MKMYFQGLNGDLGAREVLIEELRSAAQPLQESCSEEVGQRVEAAVNEAVQAWEDTRSELDALCNKYQHAVRLWQQYRDASAAVKAWADTQMGSVANLPPEEALKQVKVSLLIRARSIIRCTRQNHSQRNIFAFPFLSFTAIAFVTFFSRFCRRFRQDGILFH